MSFNWFCEAPVFKEEILNIPEEVLEVKKGANETIQCLCLLWCACVSLSICFVSISKWMQE